MVSSAARACALLLTCAVLWPSVASGAAVEPTQAEDLTSISLESLSQIKITSVARKGQTVGEAAAAVYVVTAEEIRRMGAQSIPEALRHVPGVHVARVDSAHWAVTIRGFNARMANKVLVLIDGREIYNTLFGGVLWDLHDIPVETIERIEVVRGPGGAMWGANAVNGVINIISKTAAESSGTSLTLGAGSRDGALSTAVHGGAAPGGAYRMSLRYQDRISSSAINELNRGPDQDPFETARLGFRYDSTLSDRDTLRLQGAVHRGDGRQSVALSLPGNSSSLIRSSGVDSLTAYVQSSFRRVGERGEWELQGSYNVLNRDEQSTFHVNVQTWDLSLDRREELSTRRERTWGVAYRGTHNEPLTCEACSIFFGETGETLSAFSLFAQEEWRFLDDELTVTAGARLEWTTLGSWQPAPNARVIWTPRPSRALWAAASRASRTPSWGEANADFPLGVVARPGPLQILARIHPNPGISKEWVTSYEAGARIGAIDGWKLDIVAFHSRYDDIRNLRQGAPFFLALPVPHLELPVTLRNDNAATTYGLETSARKRILPWWALTLNHAYFKMLLRTPPDVTVAEDDAHQAPTHNASVLSSWQVARGWNVDSTIHYVSKSTASGFERRGARLDAYWRADAQIDWAASRRFRASFGVQNIFDVQRIEFEPETLTVGLPVGRNVFGRLQFSF